MFQAQQEGWQVLQSLIVSASTPAEVLTMTVGLCHISLTKMGTQDNPEAFLEL